MIISHKYGFIFVKRAKTAGTSIEVLLSPLCGPADVFTPLNPPEDGHQPRNYEDLRNDDEVPASFLEHLPAWFLAEHLPDAWNHYFSFCVERNPWDKLVSAYHFHRAQPDVDPNLSFTAYLPFGLRLFGNFRDYADSEGRILVDRVLRYERLDAELAEVCAQLGIAFAGELQVRAKGGYRPPGDHYRSYYDSYTRDLVAREYAREIDEFGYAF
ncbi:MAG: hypothetical protein ACRDY6_15390 [Acidimicrobiia bacterium]